MVQIFNRNKSIMTSGTIKTTESIEVANNAKTFSLCLLSLSQKLKAPSDPAVANV
jgi:hypothetical protein